MDNNEEDFIFNISKLNKANIKAIVDSVQNKDLLEGIKTGEYHKDKSLTLAIIKNEEIKVQVNEKYLKYFNESCSFKIVNDTTPVLVYEGEELIGLICPVKNY